MTLWRSFATRAARAGAVGLIGLAGLRTPAHAQDVTPSPAPAGMLKIFLDCDQCDTEYVRQNVSFVDYVRDRTVADLHVLVTTERTGGGGLSWTVKFIGVGRFQAQDKTLSFTTLQTATEDDERKEFARIFKLGLVGYAVDTIVAPDLDVTWSRPAQAASNGVQQDPWDYWVFRVSINGNREGEKSAKFTSSFLSASANRTTDNWKIQISSNGNVRTNTFEIEDETIRSETNSWNLNAIVVKSLGPQWSIGGRASASHSSFSNTDRSFTVAPGIEYDFFPYSQSSRRSLVIQYTAGTVHSTYAAVTVYDKLAEAVPKHFLEASLGLRQPWGSVRISSSFSQQLNELGRYRESIFGNADVRLFKGFSFNIFGQYQRIADQISLPKDAVSETDVLLRAQQLQTNYSYYVSFGISYSFGSIFNSVVNPRFTF